MPDTTTTNVQETAMDEYERGWDNGIAVIVVVAILFLASLLSGQHI